MELANVLLKRTNCSHTPSTVALQLSCKWPVDVHKSPPCHRKLTNNNPLPAPPTATAPPALIPTPSPTPTTPITVYE